MATHRWGRYRKIVTKEWKEIFIERRDPSKDNFNDFPPDGSYFTEYYWNDNKKSGDKELYELLNRAPLFPAYRKSGSMYYRDGDTHWDDADYQTRRGVLAENGQVTLKNSATSNKELF